MNAQPTKTTVSNADLVRQAIEALNRHDLGTASQLWAADGVWRVAGRTYRGPKEIAGYFEELFAALPDWHLELIGIVAQGPDVFAHWHLTGRHTGAFDGIAPTGKSIAFDGIDHFVVRDDKIGSNTVIFDQFEFARQVGMMPAAGSPAERLMKLMFNVRTKVVPKRRR